MVRLEWTVWRYTNIGCLFFRKNRQFGAELVEMQAGDLFVEVLRQNVDLILVLLAATVERLWRCRQGLGPIAEWRRRSSQGH